MITKEQLRKLAEKWLEEEQEAARKTVELNERLLRGETLTTTYVACNGPSPLSKWAAAQELLAALDAPEIIPLPPPSTSDKCPRCGSPLRYCIEGEYCSSPDCGYAL